MLGQACQAVQAASQFLPLLFSLYDVVRYAQIVKDLQQFKCLSLSHWWTFENLDSEDWLFVITSRLTCNDIFVFLQMINGVRVELDYPVWQLLDDQQDSVWVRDVLLDKHWLVWQSKRQDKKLVWLAHNRLRLNYAPSRTFLHVELIFSDSIWIYLFQVLEWQW